MTKEIDLTEKCFGPDVGTIKGKTTRSKVVDQIICDSTRSCDLTLDGITVNG